MTSDFEPLAASRPAVHSKCGSMTPSVTINPMPLSDKIATIIFWLIAGGIAAIGIFVSIQNQFYHFEPWEILAAAITAVCLILGIRQLYRSFRGGPK